MSDIQQTQYLDGAKVNEGVSLSSTASDSRSSASLGRKFADVLLNLIGKTSKQPVAYVKKGKEVSFENIPFYDSNGSRLTFKEVDGATVAKRQGRPTSSRSEVDAYLRRESALSGNSGVSRAVPEFRTRASKHLRETQDLREKIVSGELETPGNRSSILKKKIAKEDAEEGLMVDAAWLSELKSQLSKAKGNGAGNNLKAIAAAMKGETSGAETELADPRLPIVKKFAPKSVNADSEEHIVRANGKKTATANNDSTDVIKSAKKSSAKSATVNEDREVVQRITIKQEQSLKMPGEAESRSLKLVRQLKQNGANSTNTPAVAEENGVDSMRKQGWRVHTPKNNRTASTAAAQQAESDPLRSSNNSKNKIITNSGEAKKEGFRANSDIVDMKKTGDLAKAQTTSHAEPVSSSGSTSTGSGSSDNSGTQQTQQSTNTGEQASRGLQNLNELLNKVESNARILTGNGRTSLSVNLKPAQLGSVNVNIEAKNGKYEVTIKAENEKSLHAIERQIPTIKQHLLDRGIQVENVEVRQGSDDGESGSFAEKYEKEGDSADSRQRSGRPTGRVADGNASPVSGATARSGRALKLGTNTMETVG